MSAIQHEPGSEVYSIHGEAGRYIARVANGHLVEPIYDDVADDEPVYADPVTWRDVFTQPPVQRLHSEVAEVEKKLTDARTALERVRAERREFDIEERARLARIKRHEQLAQLDEFLAGSITHFVVTSEYSAPEIKTAEEALRSDESGWGKKLRLLGLYGDPDRNLQWKVQAYSDGSGSTRYDVIPCTSLEQATEKLAALVGGAWGAILKDGKYHAITEYVKLARAMNLPVPQEATDRADAITRERVQKELEQRRTELAKAQAALQAAEAKATGA